MEGAAYLTLKVIAAAGVIGILAVIRFAFWLRQKSARGQIDVVLLVAQFICSGWGLLVLVANLIRSMPVPELAMQTLSSILPVTALLMAQIAIFVAAGKR